MIARDLMLAELTGGRLHVQHVSTRGGVEMIRDAGARRARQRRGAPHHFTLTDEAVETYRTDAKMNPPLRSEADRDAVRAAVRDGTLDVIATDHAPHHYDEKEQAFEDAPFGIVGLETALGLASRSWCTPGLIDLPTLVERMSCAPARAPSRFPAARCAPAPPPTSRSWTRQAEWTVDPAASSP
jgi:dihydroorotase